MDEKKSYGYDLRKWTIKLIIRGIKLVNRSISLKQEI